LPRTTTRCFCCDGDISLARKVKLRPRLDLQPDAHGNIDPAAYAFYEKEMTYRWAFICLDCYARLNNESGLALAGGKLFNLAGCSRYGRAPVVDEEKYQAFQRRAAARMGLAV
jgi:hypothetical protein